MIRRSLGGLETGVRTLIVGSGPAGLTVALELARMGHPSLVLESGLEQAGPAQDLARAEIVDPALHDDMSIAVARRLGGTSHLWGGRCVPLDPIDFEPRAYTGFARWPLAYDEIARFYPMACRYLTSGAPVFRARLPESDARFCLDNLERASNRPRFAEAYRSALATSPLIDLRLDATVVGLTFGEAGRTTHVVVANSAGQRTRIAAERVVLAAGGLECARLLLAAQRERGELFGGPAGPLGRFYMGHIIGEIADVTFASDRLDAAFDFFRDGHGSFVRRRLVPSSALMREKDLPNICFWPVVPPIANASHQSGALSAVALALSVPGLGRRVIPEAIRKRHLSGAIDWRAHAANVVRDMPRTSAFLGRFAYHRYLSRERVHGYFLRNRSRRYGLSYSSEQSPRSDSRVVLGAQTDCLGLPRLTIDLRFHREDAAAVVRAHAALADWLEATGGGRVEFRQPAAAGVEAVLARAGHGTHQIGLVRMGTNRNEAVVDRDLRCFDVPNLFVASSAVFPTSSQANPTLSIVAFAARLAAMLSVER